MTYAQPSLTIEGQNSDAVIIQKCQVTDTTILVDDASRLPILADGDFYYAILVSGDRTQAERVQVTEVSGDTLTVVRMASSPACYGVGSRIVYDGTSSEAMNQRVIGTIWAATSPIDYDATNRTVSLDVATLQTELHGLVNAATDPLSYDEASGTVALDLTKLEADLDAWVKSEAQAVITNSDGNLTITNGVVNVNITALKTALGITT